MSSGIVSIIANIKQERDDHYWEFKYQPSNVTKTKTIAQSTLITAYYITMVYYIECPVTNPHPSQTTILFMTKIVKTQLAHVVGAIQSTQSSLKSNTVLFLQCSNLMVSQIV